MEYVTVENGIATYHRDGKPVGQAQAGPFDYAAAGLRYSGCDCLDAKSGRECRHGLAHYWGEGWSTTRLREIAASF